MKKKFLIILCIILLTGCSVKNDNKDPNVNFEDMTVSQKVTYKMSNMTLEEKIAQMLMLYYYSDNVDTTLKNTLKTVKPGGFILFSQNITTYDKTLQFVKDLKDSADIPLFIGIDQEGGNVQRLNSLQDIKSTYIPYMYDLGLTKDKQLAYDVGVVMAEELRTIGVNLVFAPDMDIFSNPNNKVIGKRSFGGDKEIVSSLGCSLANGLEDTGVIAVYKHFPGHGDTSADSHYYLPVLNKTLEQLKSEELVPFNRAITNNAQVIMIGHLAVPELTKDNTPASLSKSIITDLLRKDMGFNGLVITDALNMGALTANYSNAEIYEMAINAGVDILLMPGNSKETIKAITSSINSGKISIERIDESVKRILTLKYTKIVKNNYLDSSYLGSNAHKAVIDKIKY